MILVGYMSTSLTRQIGDFIEEFVDYDTMHNSGMWTKYMQIMVQLDVRHPLKQWKRIKRQEGSWSLILFKYERVSTFCYLYVVLGLKSYVRNC